MSWAPLLYAREKGYNVATLFSSDMVVNIYKRLGFKQYTTLDFILYHPSYERAIIDEIRLIFTFKDAPFYNKYVFFKRRTTYAYLE